MSVQDIELRFLERDVPSPSPEDQMFCRTVRVLQWRKLVQERRSSCYRPSTGEFSDGLYEQWTPWVDVPMVKEAAS